MNGRWHYWWVLPAASLLSGCATLAPEYDRPPAPVPPEWPAGPAYRESAAPEGVPAAVDLGWREYFTDLRLGRVIETALENNLDLRLAALNMERVRALYDIQRSALLPSVNAVGEGGRQGQSADLVSPGAGRTIEQYGVNLGIIAWEIDLFGRLGSLKEQAREEYLASEVARRGVQVALISEVARTYLTLAADREKLELARSTLEAQLGAYNLIRRQYEVGLANELDLRRAQSQMEPARRDVARFTQLAAQSQNALQLLAGAPVPEDLLPGGLTEVGRPPEIFTGLSSEVLLNRPDIIAAEHRLKGAYASIGAARAALFPRISLTTAVGTASDELSGLFGSGSGTWSFIPRIELPIFDPRIWAAYRVSKADREIALARYEQAIQTAFREVADSLAVLGTVDDEVSAQQALTAALAETYRLSKKRYEGGIDSYLGVHDAQRFLYVAQQVLVSLQLTKLANQVRLYAVLGGGGTDAPPAE